MSLPGSWYDDLGLMSGACEQRGTGGTETLERQQESQVKERSNRRCFENQESALFCR